MYYNKLKKKMNKIILNLDNVCKFIINYSKIDGGFTYIPQRKKYSWWFGRTIIIPEYIDTQYSLRGCISISEFNKEYSEYFIKDGKIFSKPMIYLIYNNGKKETIYFETDDEMDEYIKIMFQPYFDVNDHKHNLITIYKK